MNQSNPGFGGYEWVMGGPQIPMPPMGSPGVQMKMLEKPPRMPERMRTSSPPTRSSRNFDDGVNVKDNFQRVKARRAEMKGPSTLMILSGLKTRKLILVKMIAA